jgi:DNA-binding XRE family transcriptional regulator
LVADSSAAIFVGRKEMAVNATNTRARLRRQLGLSQRELARQIGVTGAAICMWEQGRFELRPELVGRIAEVIQEQIESIPIFDGVDEMVGVLAPSTSVEAA